jgi:16S rRNA (guanine966-N2)-methyltransferase
MRVIGGTAKGRRVGAPPGRDTRPTPDRVREALFSSVASQLPGANVLDLYAGSGALGIEALSRGAARATFVERATRATATLRANLADTALADVAEVVQADARRFCADPVGGPFDLVLIDPPYDEPLAAIYDRLDVLLRNRALQPGATVVVERSVRDPDLDRTPPGFLASERSRAYGDTVLIYLRVQPDRPEEPG